MPTLTAARGLVTSTSEITRPDGALSIADNIVLDYSNVIQQRRGLKEYSQQLPGNSFCKQLLTYKNVVLAYYAQTLAYDNGSGTFTAFTGSYSELVPGLRIKYFESNGNFFFTSDSGVKKISALSTTDFSPSLPVTDAGGITAIDLSAELETNVAGFLPAQSKTAYRLVYGTKDANSNVIYGAPSARVVLTNTSADVQQQEMFTINILNYAGITASQYFTFDTVDSGYFVWYDVTGSNTAPATADTLNRQAVKVAINGLTTNAQVAAQTANIMAANIGDITVAISTTEITVTMVKSGDTGDASQGNISASDILVTKLFDGQISPGVSANGVLQFTLPETITTNYFYQVYRTGISTVTEGLTLNDIDPGDEMNMVFETPITSVDITAGVITVTDNTPDNFRASGQFLYTNPISGEGILQANNAPPIAQDIALFRNSAFYANTKDVHRFEFNMLSVDDFVSGNTKLTIGRGDTSVEYTFTGVAEELQVDVLAKSETVGSSYFTLNSASDARRYYLWMDKGSFTRTFNSTSDVNAGTETITIANHGWATNDVIILSGTVPGGLAVATPYYVIRVNANSFQLKSTLAGSAINISTAVGTATVSYSCADPNVANRIGIRVPLLIYDDSVQESKTCLLDTLSQFSDFACTDFDANTVKIVNSDSGNATNPTQSTPAPGWTITVTQEGNGEDALIREVLLSANTSPGLAIDLTARSLVRVINRDIDCPVFATYLSGADDLPGKILLQAKTLVDESFAIAINDASLVSEFSPELAVNIGLTSINNTTNVFTASTTTGFTAGTKVYINDNPGGTPTEFGGVYTIATTPTPTTFTLVGIDVGINQPGPLNGSLFRTLSASDNNVNPNRLYFSKLSQPEAVPLVNYVDIGPRDKPIYRILALRDNLFVLKEDGIYVISGDSSVTGFSSRLLDNSACLIAPDTAVVLNNLIYMLSGQGVVTVSETGVSIISRNIEDQISKVTTFNYDYFYTSFSVSYETDRAYLLWLPTRKSDTQATQCYRYNTLTNAWTRWTVTAKCGVVNFGGKDLLHIGSGVRPYVLQERKTGDRTDYADRDFIRQLATGAVNDLVITLSSVTDVDVGDAIVQEQYLSAVKFNRLLKILDKDIGVGDSDYYSELVIAAGGNMANALSNLITKLNADPNLFGSFTPSSGVNTITALRNDFNVIIGQLNGSGSGTSYKNYKTVTELLSYETIVTSIDKTVNKVVVNLPAQFLEGNVTVYKRISSVVLYAPQHFGKPEVFKQIREGTLIFDQDVIYSGSISYSSDRSADFVEIPFTMEGAGTWGDFSWGDIVWGGLGNERPLRTLIPQNKSRCRYLNVKFNHFNAREQYKLIGISLEPREYSTRAYR
jgi:hypothetical protein